MWFSCRRARGNRFAVTITGYLCAEISQINRLSHENGLDVAPLASVCAVHVVEKKKFLTLLIIQVKGTCTSSLRALFRSLHDKSRLRWPGFSVKNPHPTQPNLHPTVTLDESMVKE